MCENSFIPFSEEVYFLNVILNELQFLHFRSYSAYLKGVLSGSSMALWRRMAGPPPALRSVGYVLM